MMKNKYVYLIFIVLVFSWVAPAQNVSQFFDEADALFAKYVNNGRVNYQAIKSDPELLDQALRTAASLQVSISDPATYQAFWINAYNLATIKGVVENYPLKSPLDVKGFFDKKTYTLAGESLTLNAIENDKLRAEFDEPRFHFVLVCAARSCPPIINKAYRPDRLEQQLQSQTVKALNDNQFLRVDGNSVQFSQIMEWYKEDFTRNGRTLIQFTNQYRKSRLPLKASTGFYPYNWRLNDSK
ncbi:DUF547 domain-containing protein [Croceiramulus getboli]|nr:DUF547 domain-containing protein [Flavobacteriaceae bacterium YJPT1-3]